MKWVAAVIVLFVLAALGANWLFKQRSVSEMEAALKQIKALRKK